MIVITITRKPLEGTVAANALIHGTGGINIDATRNGDELRPVGASDGTLLDKNPRVYGQHTGRKIVGYAVGRWPANLLLTAHPAVAKAFPADAVNYFKAIGNPIANRDTVGEVSP